MGFVLFIILLVVIAAIAFRPRFIGPRRFGGGPVRRAARRTTLRVIRRRF
ncbi:MAG: hypothetical protein WEA61_05965 [Anaerolineales bacterium]